MNEIRFFFFISGVLSHQQSDPLCGTCKAFANTALRIKEGIEAISPQVLETELPADVRALFTKAAAALEALRIVEDSQGQKKAGNCKMPEGVCFIKYSKALRDRL